MQEISPAAPEERRKRAKAGVRDVVEHRLHKLGPGSRAYEVAKRTLLGVWSDGFIHAGNLAFLTLVTLFPFFIVTAALAGLFGRNQDAIDALANFVVTLPPTVRDAVEKPIIDVLSARTGWLLWLGAAVGLWTVGSYIETIRDILRRAYGTPFTAPFWKYRLASIGVIIGSVVLTMIAFSAQVLLTAAEEFVYRLLPFAENALSIINLSRWIPMVVLFGAIYALIWALTPTHYRYSKNPKWPGALFIAVWWQLMVWSLPYLLYGLDDYDLTYGSLAGAVITLFFFWFIGLGVVVGAHLNAALAEPDQKALKAPEVVPEGA